MRFPGNEITYEGRVIAVKKLEEIGGDNQGTALYQDRAGKYYAYYHSCRLSIWDAARRFKEIHGTDTDNIPNSNAEILRLQEWKENGVIQLNERGALEWYRTEFVNDGPIKRLFKLAIQAFVPPAECAGKTRLSAWTDRRTAAAFRAAAKSEGRLSTEQLTFLIDACAKSARVKPRRRKAKAGTATPGSFAVQLEMATALVECARKLDADPSIENLVATCRAASKAHQSIHAPGNFKLAAQG